MSKDLVNEKQLAARQAVKLLQDGQIVGLGTGSTALYAIQAIGERVAQGLKIQAVATSVQTEALAENQRIPLIEISTVESIDITIDGTDEFTRDRLLIKGGGGALLREKIVALLSRQVVIIADSSKRVETLGKFKVPLAVVPYASNYVLRQLPALHGQGKVRMTFGIPFRTDEGTCIIDADFGLINDPVALSGQLNAMEGIVAHGLFIGLASQVIMGQGDGKIVF